MASPLWSPEELAQAFGSGVPADAAPIEGVAIDTRTLRPGDLFVALPGDPGPRFKVSSRSGRDGHDFLAQAQAAGAAGALVSRPEAVPPGLPAWIVDDTIDGLWALGRSARERVRGPVFAITGSSGKTTTKQLLAAAADAVSQPGSLNNYLGVPVTLARMPARTGPAVVEIGMNHAGEIAPLSMMTRPDVAVVVNVLNVHSENFDDPDGIRREKLSITAGLRDDGVLVVRHGIRLEDQWRGATLTFGDGRADAWITDLEGETATLEVAGTRLEAHVPGGGMHRAESVLAALLACHAAGIELRDAAERLAHLEPPRGRGNFLRAGAATLIDDSYNANPASMRAALRQLAAVRGPTTALLGEMLELDDPDGEHAGLAESTAGIDRLVLVGEGMRALQHALGDRDGVAWVASVADLDVGALARGMAEDETVLLKGSNRVFWASDFAEVLFAALQAPRA